MSHLVVWKRFIPLQNDAALLVWCIANDWLNNASLADPAAFFEIGTIPCVHMPTPLGSEKSLAAIDNL